MRSPDNDDLALRALFDRELAHFDPAGYRLEHSWGDRAESWFVEVEPTGPGPAPISAHVAAGTLSLTFGHTWLEWKFFDDDGTVSDTEELIGAVLQGQFEEAGSRERAFAHVDVASGILRVGHLHWPVPWRWRSVRRYESYPLR